MTVSIIIAVAAWQKNLEECAAKCGQLDYPDFEIIVLPDKDWKQFPMQEGNCFRDNRDSGAVKIIPTGEVNPAHKRDFALRYANGEILAFIDDDAYPDKHWLKNAIKNFSDPQVAAVGGPAVTPQEDSLMQKASGAVYASSLVSGSFVYRYRPLKIRQVDDYPSCNFLVRKTVMQELGGFNTNFWPGEDTKLCLDITKKLGKKIIYDPSVLVYHHRRPLFTAHLKQVASYALHRGYFVKKFPQTSRKPAYFLPSLFVLGLFCGAIGSLFSASLRTAYFSVLILYLAVALLASLRELRLALLVFMGILFTHFTYGVYFLKGLFSSRLKEE